MRSFSLAPKQWEFVEAMGTGFAGRPADVGHGTKRDGRVHGFSELRFKPLLWTLFDVLDCVWDLFSKGPSDIVVVDIGSGRGKTALQLGLCLPVKSVLGVELSRSCHQAAVVSWREYLRDLSLVFPVIATDAGLDPEVNLLCGDAFQGDGRLILSHMHTRMGLAVSERPSIVLYNVQDTTGLSLCSFRRMVVCLLPEAVIAFLKENEMCPDHSGQRGGSDCKSVRRRCKDSFCARYRLAWIGSCEQTDVPGKEAYVYIRRVESGGAR